MRFFTSDYGEVKQSSIYGRYITYDHISPLLKTLGSNFKVTVIGKSVQGTPIESVDFGSGPSKILMWSQMHGDESTTTKAVLDLLNFIKSRNTNALKILKNCTIRIIPILNPDGAAAYTRVNANGVDLNRDAQDLSQPESRALRTTYEDFNPDFCFNLHDQRTMYNVGVTDKPATVSFLAPAFDHERSISRFRQDAMIVIYKMNEALQQYIPGQVGRYDDSFNANCVGDTFQMLKTPTVLFEAGHFHDDYKRERTRELIFIALLEAVQTTMTQLGDFEHSDYLAIPENGKRFFDILIKNAHCFEKRYDQGTTLGIRYKEILIADTIHFEPKLESIAGEGHYLGHKTFDCNQENQLSNLIEQPFFTKLFSKYDNQSLK